MPSLSRTFCCLAIPLYNHGLHLVMLETFCVGMTFGVLSCVGPSTQAVSIPSFGPYLFGIACIATALLQPYGFYSIFKEKPGAFKLFQRLNLACLVITFLIAGVWIILSGIRHQEATDACAAQFYKNPAASTSAQNICNIFCYVQLGVMVFVWLFFFLVQGYFCLVCHVYTSQQKRDRSKYNSLFASMGDEKVRESLGLASRASKSSDDLNGPFLPYAVNSHSRQQSQSSLRNEWKPPIPADATQSEEQVVPPILAVSSQPRVIAPQNQHVFPPGTAMHAYRGGESDIHPSFRPTTSLPSNGKLPYPGQPQSYQPKQYYETPQYFPPTDFNYYASRQ